MPSAGPRYYLSLFRIDICLDKGEKNRLLPLRFVLFAQSKEENGKVARVELVCLLLIV